MLYQGVGWCLVKILSLLNPKSIDFSEGKPKNFCTLLNFSYFQMVTDCVRKYSTITGLSHSEIEARDQCDQSGASDLQLFENMA